MKIEKSKNSIRLKYNAYFLFTGFLIFAIAVFLFSAVFKIILIQESFIPTDIADIVFITAFIFLVFGLSVYSLISGFKKLEITESGVRSGRRFYSWAEIKDWGVSYYATVRSGDSFYCLYFSENKLHGKLKGKMIKFIVSEKNLSEIIDEVIPFCKEKTEVSPIIFRQFEV